MIGNLSGVSLEYFRDNGRFPNSVYPVIIYRQALPESQTSPERLEALFDSNGWPSQWRSSVYNFHHYHSTAHECMGVAQGEAELCLGGPGGRVFTVRAGDVLALPAGTAHQRLEARDNFLVVGAYPPGQEWDMLKGEIGERPGADRRIPRVHLPITDPVGGSAGPVLESWR